MANQNRSSHASYSARNRSDSLNDRLYLVKYSITCDGSLAAFFVDLFRIPVDGYVDHYLTRTNIFFCQTVQDTCTGDQDICFSCDCRNINSCKVFFRR